MDDDLGVKVTVTRLRRRLSVESEDSTNSPSTPSTPTKKRGGRLAAKPQLELIDEANENVPKKTTRKSVARDIEPAEDKVLTPSRRSARIRSNTSLLADTPKAIGSPRAKRAARRTSQLGSDNETPVAPARQTRRTRKDSSASVDIAENENEPPITKQTRTTVKTTDAGTTDPADDTSSNDQFIVYVVTTRDIEDTSDTQTVSNNNKTVTEEKDTGTSSPRKSPRIQNKKDNKTPPQRKPRKSNSINNSTVSEDTQPSEAVNNVTPEKNDSNKSARLSVNVTKLTTDVLSGASVIEEVNIVDKETELNVTSVFQELNDNKGSPLNKSVQKESSQSIPANVKTDDKNHDSNNSSDLKSKVDVHTLDNEYRKSDAEILLESSPGKNIESVVMIEDSDSNCGSGKLIMDIDDDQCVPVVKNQFENNTSKHSEVEPMDIDETIPDNITINNLNDTRNGSKEEATVPNTSVEANMNRFLNQSSILSISLPKDIGSTINRNQGERINTQETIPATVEPENIRKNLSSNVLDSDGEKNKSLNKSNSKSRRSSSISIPLESENLSNVNESSKSKRKSSISAHSDSNSNLNQSSNKSHDSPSNKEMINLNASSNKSLLNCSVQLNDGDSKKLSSSICSTDKEENSINKSKRKSSLSDPNNSKLLQSANKSNNDTMKDKSRNSNQHALATENNDISIDNKQDSTEKINKSKRKSSINKDQNSKVNLEESMTNDNNKNKTNATVAQADSQNLEKSTNENKSTLVLSQLKDMSTNDTKNESNNDISRSDLTTDIVKDATKHISENYSTSTPLQQKSMQKLAMQINTSMISPSVTNKSVDVKTTKNVSAASSDTSDSSDEEQEETKKDKSKIDDEASEASDDYESGDSRDDEERQYEEENEIREKGETLESEQDFSNDSDYEKDSFIVSSDEEDNEMLSGTGDDLTLSDRELTMSKKSKKKYDERKDKEQKKASREMYEARHNINKSNDKSNKKSKPQCLESSESESDEEVQKPKKKNRRRIDSSHEATIFKSDGEESIGYNKKKIKRLSESVCEENDKSHNEEFFTHKKKKATRLSASLREENADSNEKEITICNESAINNKDPLINAIKMEPKTPQKVFNISTVPIVDNMEEVQVDANMTVMNSNETSDPLQVNMAEDEDSLSSENEEIMQNYDSVLNSLNDQRKIKHVDTSLNINKKSNAKAKEPIIDQLNLTQTKSKKNNKKKNKEKTVTKSDKNESDVSDSIDMQLLFPEDSNDSESNSNKVHQSKQELEPAEEFIPLKKTPAKTHIPQKIDIRASLNNSELNTSKSKKKQKSSLLLDEAENTSEATDDGIKIFIDTTGTLDLDSEGTNTSASKKKKKKQLNKSSTNDSIVENNDTQNVTIDNIEMEPPIEVLFKSDKKKKKKNKNSDESSITYTDTESNEIKIQNVSSNNMNEINETENKETPKSEKKKKIKNNDISIVEQSDDTTSRAKKKAKKSVLDITEINVENIELNTSQKSEKKKKKNKHIGDTVTPNKDLNSTSFIESIGLMFEDLVPNMSPNTSIRSEKKKKKNKNLSIEESSETEITSAKKKSKKLSESLINDTDNIEVEAKDPEPTLSESLNNSNKKKKNKQNNSIVEPTSNAEVDGNLEVSFKSEKKKKNKGNTSEVQELDSMPQTETIEDTSLTTKKKKKKNKSIDENIEIGIENKKSLQNISEDILILEDQTETVSISEDGAVKSKKKKKKRRDNNKQNVQTEIPVLGDLNDDDAPEEVTFQFEKATPEEINEQKSMKRKLESENQLDTTAVANSKKKRKLVETEGNNQEEVNRKGSKKRKRPHGSVEELPPKVFKENSLDDISVPRLPRSILDKLNDKPQLKKKPKAIATSEFIVEDARSRKNKPSTYLEQSVYLNDTPKKDKKKYKNKEIPIVLPFIPTAATSDQGYTSKFKINVLPQETQFVAQASNVGNFKNELLSKQRIKKLGTFEKFKSQRSRKLCKF